MLRTSKRGFALVLVLGLVATAVVLGLGYLYTASIKLTCVNNLLEASRARYLAESGLEHALYVMQTNIEALENSASAPLGPFYADNSSDGYVFYAVQDESDPQTYTVFARGTSGEAAQTATFTVHYTAVGKLAIDKGMMVGGGMVWLPSSVEVSGNCHFNGSVVSTARIKDDVSATGFVWDPLRRIDGTVTQFAEPIDAPDITWERYKEYTLSGNYNVAITKKTDIFDAHDPLNKGGAIGPGNVGGVVWLKPRHGDSVTLARKVDFKGTLIIDGDLVLDGKDIKVTAEEGFPAIVATGRIYVTNDAKATIKGVVVAGDGITSLGRSDKSKTKIEGSLVTGQRGYDFGLQGDHKIKYEEDRCLLYDFSGNTAGGSGVTVGDAD